MVSEIKLAIVISATKKGFAAFNETQGALRRIKATLSAIRTELGVLAAGGAIGVFQDAIGAFADFEARLVQAGALLQATTNQMVELNDVARELGRTTIFTAKEVADGMFFMAQAGQSLAEVTENIDEVLTFAQAGMLDLGKAADLVTDIMKGMRLTTDDLGNAIDILTFTAANFTTTAEQLGEGFKFVGPLAAEMGISIEGLSAALGILADAGQKGSMGGAGLRRVLTSMLNPSREAQKIMDKYNISLFDAEGNFIGLTEAVREFSDANLTNSEIMKVFADRAGTAFLALQAQLDGNNRSLEEFTERLEGGEAEGFAKGLQNIFGETLFAQIKQMQSAFSEIMIQLGEGLAPLLKEFIDLMVKETGEGKFFESLINVVIPLVELFRILIPVLEVVLIILTPLLQILAMVLEVLVTIFNPVTELTQAFANFWEALIPDQEVRLGLEAVVDLMDKIKKGQTELSETFSVDAFSKVFSGPGGAITGIFKGSRQGGGLIQQRGLFRLERGEEVLTVADRAAIRSGGGDGGAKTFNITIVTQAPVTAQMLVREANKAEARLRNR